VRIPVWAAVLAGRVIGTAERLGSG